MVQPKLNSNSNNRVVKPVSRDNSGANADGAGSSSNSDLTSEDKLKRTLSKADTLLNETTDAELAFNAPTTEERLTRTKDGAFLAPGSAGFNDSEKPRTTESNSLNPTVQSNTFDSLATQGSAFLRTENTFAAAGVDASSVTDTPNTEESALPELFVGDPPVTGEWLEYRNNILDEIRSDYKARAIEFPGSDAEFMENYSSEPNELLNSLAIHYEKGSSAELLESYPDIIDIALRENRSERAGPGLNGRSMISGEVLVMIDMQLSDPDVLALMEQIDTPLVSPDNTIARNQMYLYGEERFEQIQKYHAVMQNVRNDYLDVLHTHGRDRNSEFIEVPSREEMQAWETSHQAIVDEGPEVAERASRAQFALSGPKPHEIYREYHDRLDASNDAKPRRAYNVDAMTEWYVQQDTPSTRLFNAFFGQSTYDQVAEGSIRSSLATHEFTGGGWGIRYGGTEGGMWQYNTGFFVNDQVKIIDFNNVPELHNPEAIFFSPDTGWSTPAANIVQENHWLEDAIDIIVVGGVGLYFGGVGAGIGAGIGGVGGAIIGGMVGGGATSAFAGAYHGNFDWGDVWDGALTGGLTAGLSNIRALQQLAQYPGGSTAVSTLTGGVVSEIVNGEFEEGAINGFLAGLSNEMFTNMNSAIDQSGLTGSQATAARQTARLVSTAVRVANTDGHPGQVLAQGLLNDLIQHVGEPIYDAGFEWGFNTGESIREGVSEWFGGGGGAGDGEIIEIPASAREIKTDEELRTDIERYQAEFDAELNSAITSIEDKIASLDESIQSTPSHQPAHYLFNAQRNDLLVELNNLQQIANDPNAAIVSLLAASASRAEGGSLSASDLGHLGLDIVGLIPVVGEWADVLNAAWYASEGRPLDAALSSIGVLPGPVGMSATIARWTSRAEEIGSLAIGETFEITADMLSRGGKIAGRHNAGPNAPKFRDWLDRSPDNRVVVQPDGSVTYTGSSRNSDEIFSVTFDPAGIPDFSDYSHGRVDVNIDLDARRGNTANGANFRNDDYTAASEALWDQIKNNPEAQSQFTARQLRELQAGRPQIHNMTWHHAGHSLNTNGTGPMMLVDSLPHSTFSHRGWYSYLRSGEI